MSASIAAPASVSAAHDRAGPLAAVTAFFGRLAHQARVRRDNARLAQLDDHMLSDIGLMRGDVVRLAGNDDQPQLRISGTPF